jgi:asparagine synthase (glutamine-hydrolysing)
MCGFYSFISSGKFDVNVHEAKAHLIKHRGPDSTKHVTFNENYMHVLSVFHRLSINDLSVNGDQPFTSADDRYLFMFNGECYNFREIKDRYLKNEKFTSESDSEVVFRLYQIFGDEAFKKVRGMFSICIIDKFERKLILVRDQFGIKPLYYNLSEKSIGVCSETLPLLNTGMNQGSFRQVQRYFLDGHPDYVTQSFYSDLHVVKPGEIVKIQFVNDRISEIQRKFFDYNFDNQFCAESVDSVLKSSISLHSQSDAKAAIALSGGIDSSLIACMNNNPNVNCGIYSETNIAGLSDYARAKTIAEKSGLQLLKSEFSSHELKQTVNRILSACNQPIRGPQSILQYNMFKRASEAGYKVVIEGQGADELFLGYPWYLNPTSSVLLNKIKPLVRLYKQGRMSRKLFTRDFQYLITPEEVTLKEQIAKDRKYLLGELLFYGDRMAMINGVENRVPFVDPDVHRFALSLSNETLIVDGYSKYPLRKLLSQYSHEVAFELNKKGFSLDLVTFENAFFDNENVEFVLDLASSFKNILNNRYVEGIFQNKHKSNFYQKWKIYNFLQWADENNVIF